MMEKVTVFTPTYNRGKELAQLYRSLCNQTVKDFIWLIIDDGSTDSTEAVVRRFIEEAKFKIQYQKQENAGKYAALKRAFSIIETEYFVCVDSDDWVLNHFIERILHHWAAIKELDTVALVTPMYFTDGRCSCKHLPGKELKTKFCVIGERFKGETTITFKTRFIQPFVFPTFPGEKFAPEGIIYSQLDQTYFIKFIDEKLSIMEYHEDGLTRNVFRNWVNNPQAIKELLSRRYHTCYGLKLHERLLKKAKTLIFQNCLALSQNTSIAAYSSNKAFAYVLAIPSFYIYKKKFL